MTDNAPFPVPADDAVLLKAAELMVDKVLEWVKECDHSFRNDEDDRSLIMDILTKTLESDGYKIAKDFDEAGFYPDARLVDILDNMTINQYHALREARKAWVVATGWKTDLVLGDKVKVPGMISRSGKAVSGWHDGVVSKINADEGTINVQKGDHWNGSGDGSVIPHTLVNRRAS